MMRILAVIVLIGGLVGCWKSMSINEMAHPAPSKPAVSVDQLALKMDPYCKMSMERHGIAALYEYQGKKYGFCSDYCKEQFAKEPEKYLKAASDPPAAKPSM